MSRVPGVAFSAPLEISVPIVMFADAFEMGGTPVYAVNVAVNLRRRGYRVAVICPSVESIPNIPFQRQGIDALRECLERAGVEIHPVERQLTSPMARLSRIITLTDVIRQYPNPIVVLMMGYFLGGGPMTVAARLAGVRAIIRAELQPPMPPIKRSERLAVRLKDLLIARMVVGSVENRETVTRLMGINPRRVEVINTGIETTSFQPDEGREKAREEIGLAPRDIGVGVISRLAEERKGIGQFLRMAATAAACDRRLRFVVVGDGYSREWYEGEASRLGLNGLVVFTGWRSDVARLLAAIDIFVMPSLAEGGPTSVLEAMAMARSVVATRVGMVPEIIRDGESGIVCEPGDEGALSHGVLRLAADPTARRQMGIAARQRVLEDLTLDAMVDRYLDLFRRVHDGA